MMRGGRNVGLIPNDDCNIEWCFYCLVFGKTYSISKIFLNEHSEGTAYQNLNHWFGDQKTRTDFVHTKAYRTV